MDMPTHTIPLTTKGHPLQGQVVTIPSDYEGVILEENTPLSAVGDNRELKQVGTLDKFTYWNWDKKPSSDDKIVKALQWLEVASVIHKSIHIKHEEKDVSVKNGKRKVDDD